MQKELAQVNKYDAIYGLSVKQEPKPLDNSLFSKELAPHYMDLAANLARSTMIPKALMGKPMDIFVAMAMGYQLGMPVEQALQDIAVINGRPCLWGDGLLAVCSQHKDFEDIIEQPILNGTTVTGYECTVKRKGRTETVRKYTLEMAKKAGLLGKQGPWTTSTERMLQLRARSFALRDSFADALRGIKSREEVEDCIDAEYEVSPEMTRAEKLRNDYLMKQGATNDTAEMDKKTAHSEIAISANENDQSRAMESSGTEENQTPIAQSDERLAIKEQLAEIEYLIGKTGFSEERLGKALAYYEVTKIEELSGYEADHFIKQLSKE